MIVYSLHCSEILTCWSTELSAVMSSGHKRAVKCGGNMAAENESLVCRNDKLFYP